MSGARAWKPSLSVCFACIVPLCGCQVVEKFEAVETAVSVPPMVPADRLESSHPDYDHLTGAYDVRVRASGDTACRQGVLDMRNGDWGEAAGKLEQAVAKDDKDHRAHFALGVAYEEQGEYEKALEEYKAANRASTKLNEDYDASRRRVQAKLKYKRNPASKRAPAVP